MHYLNQIAESLFRKTCIYVFLALAMAVTCYAGKSSPNFIIFFTDDQGWADLGVQGIYDDLKTPNIDRMAEEGVRFTNGYVTSPQCTPSRAGLLSGQYQNRF